MNRSVWVRIAGLREDGVPCVGCSDDVAHGQEVVACDRCGTIHHWACWQAAGGCNQFDCPSAGAASQPVTSDRIRISASDLDNAVPLPAAPASFAEPAATVSMPIDPESQRWNKLAVASFVVALLGIPLFGIATGLLAVATGVVSLAGRHSLRRRGLWFAAAGIVLGILDFVGWAVYLSTTGGAGHAIIDLDELEPDLAALQNLPPEMNRAIKANVLIRTHSFLHEGLGSGVVLRVRDGEGLIITNRHVIDPSFESGSGSALEDIAQITVKALGQPVTEGTGIWLAPHGIDLALLTTSIQSGDILPAAWDAVSRVQPGDPVFAIGNPQGLGWTMTSGDVSQLRRQKKQVFDYGVIQTSAAINLGNSGGGLYDETGRLIGINTWTHDKRFAEGLGFAIAFRTLFDLLDGELDLPRQHLPD